ncbi:hypothetical protein WA158_005667 [Blastocystis sp. Blastoise]
MSAPQESTKKDFLLSYEESIEQRWESEKTNERNAPEDLSEPHFMCTFPFPYMNGMLHLGHAYTVTKAEFAARYNTIKGKNSLFPFGFHCTGMPIQASANKLKHELELYGCPPVYPEEEEEVEVTPVAAPTETTTESVPGEFHGKKTKLVAKTGGNKASVYHILKMMDISDEDIPKFTDPIHWLEYFPPYGVKDLKRFGVAVDWRRSFITTDYNKYFDSFVRWQFGHLKASDKVAFGKRPVIFSPLDNQVCADHDRAQGEGILPQQYTCIKLQVLELKGKLSALEGKKVYLVAATLRPETMYGQTNCYILPSGEYGCYEMKNGEVYVCSERSARNMAFQDLTENRGETKCLLTVSGMDLMGLPLKAPNAFYDKVYTLPLLTISMTKGTGVVTSVPSDAPADYAALRDLKEKPKLREKYNITDDMVLPYEVVEIIEVPGLGRQCAVTTCDQLNIKSQNDTEKLEQAKEITYKKGFYEGIMLVGSQKGKKVEEAKPLVQTEMIANNDAFMYYEPNGLVTSRSGDECVVTFADQWYIKYGEEKWQQEVVKYVNESLNTYGDSTKTSLLGALDWLKEWAISRQYGLGTRIPWDPQFVIESLSDSTIYMAYYTIAHFLQGDVFGKKTGSLDITADQMTPGCYDYIFLEKEYDAATMPVSEDKLSIMRREFNYWYPFDLRVSGKDLIQNHLSFCLYNHAAIWTKLDKMPKGYFCNGHLLFDNEKMSKSKGNFKTLSESVELFSADGARYGCALAGDTLDDANYDTKAVSSYITTAYNNHQLFQGILDGSIATVHRDAQHYNKTDAIFLNGMAKCAIKVDKAFAEMRYRDAASGAFYDLLDEFSSYRLDCSEGCGLSYEVMIKFMEVYALLMYPIAPHTSDYIWTTYLKHEHLITKGDWPSDLVFNPVLSRENDFIKKNVKVCRDLISKKIKAKEYKPWQQVALNFLHEQYNSNNKTIPKDVIPKMKEAISQMPEFKSQLKNIMAFASFTIKTDFPHLGEDAFTLETPFNEKDAIEEFMPAFKKAIGCDDIIVVYNDDETMPDPKKKKDDAKPGKPGYNFIY